MLDADGLNLLAREPRQFERADGADAASRRSGAPARSDVTAAVERDRFAAVRELARRYARGGGAEGRGQPGRRIRTAAWRCAPGATRAWPRAAWATCSPASSPACWRRAATRVAGGLPRRGPACPRGRCRRASDGERGLARQRPAAGIAAVWAIGDANDALEPSWMLPDEAATAALAARVAAAHRGRLPCSTCTATWVPARPASRVPCCSARGAGSGSRAHLQSGRVLPAAGERIAWHLDLYRIADPDELEWLGLDALAEPGAVVLIEWPDRGAGALPRRGPRCPPRLCRQRRRARLVAATERGERLLAAPGAVAA